MTEDGRKLETARITNSPQALRREIAKAGTTPQVAVEAAYGWYWAADVLQQAGAEVHLAHPLGVKAFSYRRVKNDERDAADLADLVRMGRRGWTGWTCPSPTRARSPRCGRSPARWPVTCWPGTRATTRSGGCRTSARCWPRSSWPRSATSAASPVPGSWPPGPG